MKKYSALICFFFSFTTTAQEVHRFQDDFEDGNFSFNPSWSGTTDHFIVNTALQLQLSAPAQGTSWLSSPLGFTPSSVAKWQTTVRQSFSPSANNYGRIYLMSDESDLTKPLHGYYLQFGEAGSNDAIELFYQNGADMVSICRATNGAIATSFLIAFSVTLDQGLWTLAVDYSGGSHFTTEASGTHQVTINTVCYFGLLCVYTSSNATKFFYDDIAASSTLFQPDTIPTVNTPEALPKDIIITEILADPDPAVGLPDKEYVEIFNRSDHAIDLTGFQLSDGGTPSLFPAGILTPGEYRILTALSSVTFFPITDKLTGLESFPSLSNTSDHVILKNRNGITIDSVSYTSSWYNSSVKSVGGWSLELIDVHNPCGEKDNWTASENLKGGTPGYQNSVYADKPDVTGPELVDVIAVNDRLLQIIFSEKLERASVSSISIICNPEIKTGGILFHDSSLRIIDIMLGEPLDSGTVYDMTISNVADCNKNLMQEMLRPEQFALSENAAPLDILINEILFNPRPSGVDFVELYNRSEKFINLKGCKLSHDENDVLTDIEVITLGDLIIPPHRYLVITSDDGAVKNNYPASAQKVFFVSNVPSMPDDEGTIALADSRGTIIDHFSYSKNFHTKLLHDDEGVSLERITPIETNDSQNWRSASTAAGNATPGYINSCYLSDEMMSGTVAVEPEIFVPQSGREDFTIINYHLATAGAVGNIQILDQQGRIIRTISNNETLGVEGFFRWDGDRDDGTRARMGYYLVWFQIFELTGEVTTYRRRVVIAE